MADKRVPLPSGSVIQRGVDKYVISGEPIGRGGSCLVYMAHKQGAYGHPVIIKEFYPIDYENYISLFNMIMTFVKPPDLLIYIKASTSTLVTQIQKRGRKYESTIRLDYLKLYARFIRRSNT